MKDDLKARRELNWKGLYEALAAERAAEVSAAYNQGYSDAVRDAKQGFLHNDTVRKVLVGYGGTK